MKASATKNNTKIKINGKVKVKAKAKAKVKYKPKINPKIKPKNKRTKKGRSNSNPHTKSVSLDYKHHDVQYYGKDFGFLKEKKSKIPSGKTQYDQANFPGVAQVVNINNISIFQEKSSVLPLGLHQDPMRRTHSSWNLSLKKKKNAKQKQKRRKSSSSLDLRLSTTTDCENGKGTQYAKKIKNGKQNGKQNLVKLFFSQNKSSLMLLPDEEEQDYENRNVSIFAAITPKKKKKYGTMDNEMFKNKNIMFTDNATLDIQNANFINSNLIINKNGSRPSSDEIDIDFSKRFEINTKAFNFEEERMKLERSKKKLKQFEFNEERTKLEQEMDKEEEEYQKEHLQLIQLKEELDKMKIKRISMEQERTSIQQERGNIAKEFKEEHLQFIQLKEELDIMKLNQISVQHEKTAIQQERINILKELNKGTDDDGDDLSFYENDTSGNNGKQWITVQCDNVSYNDTNGMYSISFFDTELQLPSNKVYTHN